MRETYRPYQCPDASHHIQHITLLDELIQVNHAHHTIKHHVAEINLHTDATQILYNSVVQHHILGTNGIHQPSCKHYQVRQDKQSLDINDKSQYTKSDASHQSYHPMLLYTTFNAMAIEVNHTTSDEERSTIDDVYFINRLHHKVWCTKVRNGNIAEHQRQQHHLPSPLLVIEQECEERKQHIEREYRSQEPPHAYHLDIWIRQEIEAHRQVGEALAERAPRWFHHKTYHHHHGEERPCAVIPLGIKFGWSYRSRLHSLIITAAHGECTDNHKEQCKVGEPRNHVTRQNIHTWLDCHVSLYVHQHDAYGSVSTQAIQRRVIFSDIPRYGGVR